MLKVNTKMNRLTSTSTITMPSQKLSSKMKGKKWCHDNLKYWESVLMNDSNSKRKVNMRRNADLYYRGIMSRDEVAKICNPNDFENFVIPTDFRNFPISESRIQTLLGEEIKRRFNYKVFVTNRDSVSQKEDDKKEVFMNFVQQMIQQEEEPESEEFKGKMTELQEYLNYEYQDIREKAASELLHHYNLSLDLRTIYNRLWIDFLLFGEMIIDITCLNNKPVVERVDPEELYWACDGEYDIIDNADAVIRETYMPVGRVLDYFYEELSSSDVQYLDEKRNAYIGQATIGQMYIKDNENGSFIPDPKITVYGDQELHNSNFKGYFNEQGDIRVVTLRWKTMKKVGKLTYLDPESGEEMIDWVNDEYVVDPDGAEKVKWFWINEAYETTQVGEDILVNYGPRKIQYRGMDNKSECSLGYVGTRTEKALFDIMKEYQIKYNAYMYRTEQAMIKAIGKIGILDLAMIPDDWDVDMVMYYANVLGWMVKDSFKEGKIGAATGKLAGGLGNSSDSINLEQGQFIQQNMLMLQHLEQQMDLVTGINLQRRGQVQTTQGLGVMQEAREASSTITESYFNFHDNVKMRTLSKLLEVAKYLLKGKSEAIQYVTSEMASKVLTIDGDQFNEADYGIVVANATDDAQALQVMQRATEIALQTGEVDLVQLMDIFSNESTAEIQRRIKKSVREKNQQKQQQAEAEHEAQQAQLQTSLAMQQAEIQERAKDREIEVFKINTESQTKIAVAEIGALGFAKDTDADMSGVPDVMEQADLALKRQKVESDAFSKHKQIVQKAKEHRDKIKLDKQKLALEEKKLKSKEKIESMKVKVARINK